MNARFAIAATAAVLFVCARAQADDQLAAAPAISVETNAAPASASSAASPAGDEQSPGIGRLTGVTASAGHSARWASPTRSETNTKDKP